MYNNENMSVNGLEARLRWLRQITYLTRTFAEATSRTLHEYPGQAQATLTCGSRNTHAAPTSTLANAKKAVALHHL